MDEDINFVEDDDESDEFYLIDPADFDQNPPELWERGDVDGNE